MFCHKTCSIIHRIGCTFIEKKSGGDTSGPSVTNYILYTTEISVYSTICASD